MLLWNYRGECPFNIKALPNLPYCTWFSFLARIAFKYYFCSSQLMNWGWGAVGKTGFLDMQVPRGPSSAAAILHVTHGACCAFTQDKPLCRLIPTGPSFPGGCKCLGMSEFYSSRDKISVSYEDWALGFQNCPGDLMGWAPQSRACLFSEESH